MGIEAQLVGSDGSRRNNAGVSNDNRLLVELKTVDSLGGTFKSVTRSSAGTTIITDTNKLAGIVLTDLIVTTDKVNNSTVTIRFTDGTNTINIFVADVTDAPVAVAISFGGFWQGWQDARLELVTTGNVTVTTALGYYKIAPDITDTFDNWDTKR